MQLNWTRIKNRLGTVVAAIALAAGIGAIQPTPAQAAPSPTYWTFRNIATELWDRCLTSGKIDGSSTKVFMSKCNGSNFQQWDWRGTDPTASQPMLQLQNKATGLCMATDNEHARNNSVWTSKCDWRKGMRFHYNDLSHYFYSALTNYGTCLTTSDSGAVYGNVHSAFGEDSWRGSHS
ncbi:RICIN domain-containing protein [Streptomyces zagrosensis]|uniref:Ricin B lectin domain-containing protein n=1 Tax=Streptomyces zagrosensis TaxID=1042984 RepID=A0A7W9QBA7_9ACTN|nr:ricin-type beta-trefoil lectin domain protein [Streptomyces zagrosensis]MBB5936994.1 hypothetical protein [Streptomyces zagrosensis]